MVSFYLGHKITDNKMTDNKVIVQNTVIVYIRLFITIVIGLITSRFVLQALGISDYENLKSMPKVSVIMAVYKEPFEWIKQAIDSILAQTFTDFEFIIVNDCPAREENIHFLDEYSQKDPRFLERLY